jgi:heptosyltransferase III
LKNIKKILIIIQRSNGDVYLSQALINSLYEFYKSPKIDLLINDDTLAVGKLLSKINFIHTFSYKNKYENGWRQEKNIIGSIFRKYDLSINLTASDRSVLYAVFASNYSISAIEKNNRKSWWKKALLAYHYFFDSSKNILLNNLEPLNLLKIKHVKLLGKPSTSIVAIDTIKEKLDKKGIKDFIIFHPSAQYYYKIYPKHLRDRLLKNLNSLDIPILITGSNNAIDLNIKNEIQSLENLYNIIGKTSLQEYLALSELALAYIGMDTLNMHIAASQDKRIFAIFGPTNLKTWAPWSNDQKYAASINKSKQTYGKITIFQAALPCVACGKAGCDDKKGRSDCLYFISPELVFDEVNKWYKYERF